MQKLSTVLLFYKPYFFWSFAINIAITIFNPQIITAVVTKLLLIIFLWFLIIQTNRKRMLTFYNSLGISTFKLFAVTFIIDIVLTIIYLMVIKEFI